MTDAAVEVVDLVKVFPHPGGGTLRAVDGVSFRVHLGEVFGFLGPNGAGKTTTLEIAEGIQRPTSGRVSILGHDVQRDMEKIKPLIGVQLQEQEYLKYLRLHEVLELLASFYGKRIDADELLAKVGLEDKRKAQARTLSGGQLRRFSIATSLVNDPEILFLDEPTSGLDPQVRRRVWALISELKDSGKTIVLTTHYMEEAETLCDRVAIIDRGVIRALDTPLDLIRDLDSAYHIRFLAPVRVEPRELERIDGAVRVMITPNGEGFAHHIEVHDPQESLGSLSRMLESQKISTDDLRIEPSTLEDVFLSLTGRELRD